MALFEGCSVLLDLKSLPFKERKKVQSAITENGGSISYVVNKQCSLVVTSSVAALSSSRLRGVQKLGTPVVGVDYVSMSLEVGVLLPLDVYRLEVPPAQSSYPPPHRTEKEARPLAVQLVDPPPVVKAVHQTEEAGKPGRDGSLLGKLRIYTEKDTDLPTYPEDFQVAKYSIFKKVTGSTWSVVELQSVRVEGEQRYRVVRSTMQVQAGCCATRRLVFPQTSTEAVDAYLSLRAELKAEEEGLQLQPRLPVDAPQELASSPLKLLLLEERLNTGSLPQEVAVFVELLWIEALGCLDNVLSVPVTNLSLNDVSRAEGYLLRAQRLLKEGQQGDASSTLAEVYALLPHRETPPPTPTARHLSLKLDLCQLIRDMLNVSEMNLRAPASLSVGKYRSLRCGIEMVPPETAEFQTVVRLLSDKKVQVLQVLRVSRWEEQQTFEKKVGNIKPLLHSTAPSNFVGILSRGLLLPRVGAEDHGIERTDVGNLGSGIYFTDSMRTGLKYSKPSDTSGSRLLLVCDVALGRCREVTKKDPRLTQAPDTYHSVHGLRHTPATRSEFEDDEYVVYRPGQVMLRYVVQFVVEGDQLREFTPPIDASSPLPQRDASQECSLEGMELESKTRPLDDVTAGLLDGSGKQLPLQAVHVKCKLMDLLSQVVIFQKYTNQSFVPIEAKYVFPLEDSVAVCGFEAFINGKHVVGQVKEKETARKEYKLAVKEGHGAYLMDQDAPDVFTISVGNLPPGASVLIKVTFVSELIVRDDCVLFSLPGSVAPWQQSEALNQTTQASVKKTCVTNEAASSREFTLQMCIEMPYEIQRLHCSTHRVQIKKTDCKAVLAVIPGEVVGADGFQLSITLSKLHLPRMWVENHPDKDSQACMLVFYPDFPVEAAAGGPDEDGVEVVVLLDASESMVGEAWLNARRIALEVLKALPPTARLNVMLFGTEHTELFLSAKPLGHALQPARKFILAPPQTGGSTELWRPLRALSLLPPSRGPRNLLLLSDGHIQNPALSLQLLRDSSQHTRLFTCGLGSTANQHILRTLAQAGGGAYELFDTKTKHTWKDKVASQVKRMGSPGCSSVSVKWQQFNPTAPPPVQAPKHIHALFNDHHTLVYGFVPHCTQAGLHGNLSGMEVITMVSTSELQKTKGTFLHKLAARAVIRDYENGTLAISQAEHEGQKAELKSFIIELSKEFSILSQFTSFVAIEERDPQRPEQPELTDIVKIIAEEDVDFLPYMAWSVEEEEEEEEEMDEVEEELEEEEEEEEEELDEVEEEEEEMEVQLDEVEDEESPDECCYVYADSGPEKAGKGRNIGKSVYPSALMSSAAVYAEDYADDCADDYTDYDADDYEPPPPRPPPPRPRHHSHHAPRFDPLMESAGLPGLPPPAADFKRSVARSRAPAIPKVGLSMKSLPPNTCSMIGDPDAPPSPPSSGTLFRMQSGGPAPSQPLPRATFGMQLDAPPPLQPFSHTRFGMQGGMTLSSALCSSAPFGVEHALPLPSEHLSTVPFGMENASYLPSKFVSTGPVGMENALPLPSEHLSSAPFGVEHAMPHPQGGGPITHSHIFGLQRGTPPQTRASCSPRHLEHAMQDGLKRAKFLLDEGGPEDSISLHMPSRRSSQSLHLRRRCSLGKVSAEEGQRALLRSHEAVCILPTREDLMKDVDVQKKSTSLESVKSTSNWTKIFQMQCSEGYWECSAELGELLKMDVHRFASVFLKSKGINSLGARACVDILRLLASLLVLQMMRLEGMAEGRLLTSLFRLDTPPETSRGERWHAVKRAVDWVRWADHQYPCIYSRLEFGWSWESSTRQLLGYEQPPAASLLREILPWTARLRPFVCA